MSIYRLGFSACHDGIDWFNSLMHGLFFEKTPTSGSRLEEFSHPQL